MGGFFGGGGFVVGIFLSLRHIWDIPPDFLSSELMA